MNKNGTLTFAEMERLRARIMFPNPRLAAATGPVVEPLLKQVKDFYKRRPK